MRSPTSGESGRSVATLTMMPSATPTTAPIPMASPVLRAPPYWLPANGQRLQLIQESPDDRLGLARDLHVGESLQRLLEEDLQLEAGQRRAEAEVAAAGAEGLVLGVAVDVEAIGIVVDVLVPVGAHVPHQHLVAFGNRRAADFRVLGRRAAEVGERGKHAQ